MKQSKPKPFIGLIKDTHLTQHNGALVLDIFDQFICLLKKHNVHYAVHLGDLFSERTGGHNIERLMAVGLIFRMFVEAEIKLYVIPGNHDKTDLSHELSYLSVFDVVEQSEYVKIINNYKFVDFMDEDMAGSNNGVGMHFIPYFLEGEAYMKRLAHATRRKQNPWNVLCTHIAINGVRNNDGTIVDSGIPVEAFKDFDAVYVGHYHDESFIEPNIRYIPGSYQQNFGETGKKGFTLLYEDLSTTFHQSEFKPYKQLLIQATDKKAISEIARELQGGNIDDQYVCIKVKGSQAELESFDGAIFKDLGVKIKKENTQEVSVPDSDEENNNPVMLTKSDLLRHYIAYTKEYGFTPAQRNQGLKLLKLI